MQFTPSTVKKIGVVYGLLVVLILVALFIRFWQGKNIKTPTSTTTNQIPIAKNYDVIPTVVKSPLTGKISLQANSSSIKIGETGNLSILFEAPGSKLDGIDIVLRYDPRIINVLGFSEGNYFKLYPRKDINNDLGVVKVTALDSASSSVLSQEKTELGTIQFRAKTAGVSQVNFDFITGATGQTVLTQQGTSQNILGSASGVTIRVTQ